MLKKLHIPLLILITTLGGYLRFKGLLFDYPYFFHPDEKTVVSCVYWWLQGHPLAFTAYGALCYKIPGIMLWGVSCLLYINITEVYIFCRLLAMFISALTIPLVYILGKQLASQNAGLIAAFFMATSVIAIQQGHFYVPENLLSFFVVVFFIIAHSQFIQGSRFYAFVIGIMVAIAASVKIIGLLLIIPGMVYIIRKSRNTTATKGSKDLKKYIDHCISFAILISSYILINLESFLKPETFLYNDSLLMNLLMGSGVVKPQWSLHFLAADSFLYPFYNLYYWGLGLPFEILAFCGLAWAISRWRKSGNLAMLSFLIPYLYILCSSYAKFIRYILPSIPLLCVFTGCFIIDMYKIFRSKQAKLYISIALLVVASLTFMYAIAYSSMYNVDTRIEAMQWICNNIPEGSKILLESDYLHYSPSIFLFHQLPAARNESDIIRPCKYYDLDFIDFVSLYEASAYSKPQADGVLYKVCSAIGIQLSMEKNIRAIDVSEILTEKLNSAEYYILSERNYGIYRLLPEQFPIIQRFYERLFSDGFDGRFELIKTFWHKPGLLNFTIDDDPAELTFRIFDHPTIWVFKKKNP